jgi:threonylcarbamoyladenosine tRNA methylthiotransferase MtaB
MRMRKERNRVLRELAAEKNLAFRRSMIGKRLSAVTLSDPGIALSSNYLRVELARRVAANQILEIEIGGVSDSGLIEHHDQQFQFRLYDLVGHK